MIGFFTGEVRNITISRTKTDKYYISVLTRETRPALLPKTNERVGVDLGLNHLAVLSDGTKFENSRYLHKTHVKIVAAQRSLSRKLNGSSRREKAKLKVAKLYEKVTHQRSWYYHQISNYLVRNFDFISLESLSVKNMVKNRKLARSISDASWSTLVSMLRYKADWYGKQVRQIDRWFASSKTCCCCGEKKEDLDLSMREWICTSCSSRHDRDVNAAINILKQGLQEVNISEESPEYERGELIRPNWFIRKGKLDETFSLTFSRT